ncbi:hypothetical protein VUS21_33560, partial [Pseudomonas aeruginosa]|uniref:hypothetical protein n=1 Tax=Pseudomonas aeruginosa TaxID=287 RepID=UPI0030063AB5
GNRQSEQCLAIFWSHECFIPKQYLAICFLFFVLRRPLFENKKLGGDCAAKLGCAVGGVIGSV